MRASLVLVAIALVGCKWTDFDDLAETTWVHSTEKPNVGSTKYAVAAAGVTTTPQGGQLAVISNDTPNYSTLDYTASGDAALGPNAQGLGAHFIASLTDPPIFITDGMGKIALVERAIDAGNIAVVMGAATSIVDAPFSSTVAPDAAAFAAGNVIVAAGTNLHTVTGVGAPVMCTASDVMAMPFVAAAMAADASTLWVWTKNGVLVGYPIAALTPCTGGMLPNPGTSFTTTAGFMPAAGARIHILGTFAILTAQASNSRMGQVVVVDLTNMTQVGTTLAIEGLRTSTIAVFDGITYLVAGVPDRGVEGVVSGQVDIYEITPATGLIGASPVLVLNDAQPESGELFGGVVTTMKFNDKQILVVGANNEIFAYYKTSLYDALP